MLIFLKMQASASADGGSYNIRVRHYSADLNEDYRVTEDFFYTLLDRSHFNRTVLIISPYENKMR